MMIWLGSVPSSALSRPVASGLSLSFGGSGEYAWAGGEQDGRMRQCTMHDATQGTRNRREMCACARMCVLCVVVWLLGRLVVAAWCDDSVAAKAADTPRRAGCRGWRVAAGMSQLTDGGSAVACGQK